MSNAIREPQELEFRQALRGDRSYSHYQFQEIYDLSFNYPKTKTIYPGFRGRSRSHNENGMLMDKVYCPILLSNLRYIVRKKRISSKLVHSSTNTAMVIVGAFTHWEYYCPLKILLFFIEPRHYLFEDTTDFGRQGKGTVILESIEVTLKSYESQSFTNCEETYRDLVESFMLFEAKNLNYLVEFENRSYRLIGNGNLTSFLVPLDCLSGCVLPVLEFDFQGVRYYTLTVKIGLSSYNESSTPGEVVFRQLMFPVEIKETGLFVDPFDLVYEQEDDYTEAPLKEAAIAAASEELPSYNSLYPS